MGWTHRETAMSDLDWTTKTPTKPGWYWCKFPNDQPSIVVVSSDMVRWFSGITHRLEDYVLHNCEWAGPIEPPLSRQSH